MIRWCSYCQKFLGHKAPFENFSVTHGICSDCKVKVRAGEEPKDVAPIAEFFKDLFNRACGGIPVNTGTTIDRAFALGIRPLDLLMGMMQPLLIEIGNRFEHGEATITQEHLFSQFVDELLWRLRIRIQGSNGGSGPAQVLLVCADGNYHTLGLRFIELALLQERIKAHCIFPSLPAHDIVQLIESLQPKVVGVSMGQKDQTGSVRTLANQIAQLPASVKPALVVGGHGVGSLQAADLGPGAIVYDGQFESLIRLIKDCLREPVA